MRLIKFPIPEPKSIGRLLEVDPCPTCKVGRTVTPVWVDMESGGSVIGFYFYPHVDCGSEDATNCLLLDEVLLDEEV